VASNSKSHHPQLMHLLYFLLIGIAAGWLAGQIMKGGGYGLVGDLVLGVVGAIVGGHLLGGVFGGGLLGALLVATVGAMLLIALARVLKKA
jgi:uncharacterized membrane protein YeaQ/YmgE (transglycosylase-associated protein family)